jgi:hypothetical protein
VSLTGVQLSNVAVPNRTIHLTDYTAHPGRLDTDDDNEQVPAGATDDGGTAVNLTDYYEVTNARSYEIDVVETDWDGDGTDEPYRYAYNSSGSTI